MPRDAATAATPNDRAMMRAPMPIVPAAVMLFPAIPLLLPSPISPDLLR